MRISSTGQTIAPGDQFERMFCELHESEKKRLYQYVLDMVYRRDIAQDITQEVFLKFWLLKDQCNYRIEDHKAYLYRIARNEAIDYLRREKNGRRVIGEIKKENEVNLNFTEQIIYQKELEVLLQQAINQLSTERKKVYLLCKIEGVEYSKAAKLLGKSVCTVREMLRVANQQIRKYIEASMELHGKTKTENMKHSLLSLKTLKAA